MRHSGYGTPHLQAAGLQVAQVGSASDLFTDSSRKCCASLVADANAYGCRCAPILAAPAEQHQQQGPAAGVLACEQRLRSSCYRLQRYTCGDLRGLYLHRCMQPSSAWARLRQCWSESWLWSYSDPRAWQRCLLTSLCCVRAPCVSEAGWQLAQQHGPACLTVAGRVMTGSQDSRQGSQGVQAYI